MTLLNMFSLGLFKHSVSLHSLIYESFSCDLLPKNSPGVSAEPTVIQLHSDKIDRNEQAADDDPSLSPRLLSVYSNMSQAG